MSIPLDVMLHTLAALDRSRDVDLPDDDFVDSSGKVGFVIADGHLVEKEDEAAA